MAVMDPLHLLAALIVGTIATARVVRLAIFDKYPPAVAVRSWWIRKTGHPGDDGEWEDGPWTPLLECPWCFAPWVTLANLAWAAAVLPGSDPLDAWSAGWWWWLVNLWAAVAYVAAMIYVRDEPAAG